MLKQLIATLSTAEKTEFIQWLDRRNKRSIGTNITLFKQFLDGKEKQARLQMGANSFNVAKKRLQDRLLEFLGNKVLEREVSSEIDVIRWLVLARRMYAHDHFKLAQQTLQKAESKALELNHFGLLSEIYQTAINYAHLLDISARTVLFEKAQKNLVANQQAFQVNLAHAQMRSAFQSEEFGQGRSAKGLAQEIEAHYAQFNLPQTAIDNFQTLFQLAQIADLTAFQRKNYYWVDLYFTHRIDALAGTAVDAERTLIYHIDVLYLVANIYFRQRDFSKSEHYLQRMQHQMERFNRKFFRERWIQWSTLHALNLNFIGNVDEAITTLNTVFESKYYTLSDLLNPLLTRAMIHFQQGELQETQRILGRFQHTDHWYQQRVGQDWLLNRRYIEILLHIELGNVDFVQSRIHSLTRKYGKLFQTEPFKAIRPFLKLIHQYMSAPFNVTTQEFKNQVEKTIPWHHSGEEDIFLMCFYAWLKAKMTRESLYDTTIQLIAQKKEQ